MKANKVVYEKLLDNTYVIYAGMGGSKRAA